MPFFAFAFFSLAKIWRFSGVASAGRCEKTSGAKNLCPCALFRLCVFRFCENLPSYGCFFRRAVRKGIWREKSALLCLFSPLRFSLLRKFGAFRVFLPPGGAKKTSGVKNLHPCALLRKKQTNLFGFVFCFVLYLCTHFSLLSQLEVVLERFVDFTCSSCSCSTCSHRLGEALCVPLAEKLKGARQAQKTRTTKNENPPQKQKRPSETQV